MLTFIKRSTNIQALFVLMALALMVPFVSMAQAPIEEEGDTSLDNGETMMETNISNASLIGQDEDNVVIGFTLENNGTQPQFDIRYGIELVSTVGNPGEEMQVIVDTFVAREEVVLSAGERVSKVVGYPFAGIPPGTYELWVIAQTSGGATVGIAKAADYTVNDADVVEIMAETCSLTVAGEDGASYDLYQGVDVSASEDLILTCTLKNHGATAATVLPNYMTFERNVYGDQVSVAVPTQTVVTLAAGAEQEVSYTLPKATAPQAYDVVLTLTDEATRAVVSNNLTVHYVIQGASATIQNVGFSKNAYRAGEEITLNLNWTPAADTFEESRSGNGTNVGGVSAVTRVVDGNGAVCSEESTTQLASPATSLTSTSMIDCVRPTASVQLVSANGTVLDSKEIAVEVEEDLNGAAESVTGDRNSTLMFASIVAFALALLTVLIAMNRRKKIDFINASKMLFIFAVAATGFLGVQVEKAEAITWLHTYYNSSGQGGTNVTVNLNKTTFAPGETIVLTSRITSAVCANGRTPAYRLRAYLGSQISTLGYTTYNTTTHNGGGTLIAPTTPGTYNIRLEMKVLSYISNRYVSITVTAPTPPAVAAQGNFDSVNPTTCSVAGWAYDPDAASQSILVHVYRDGPAGGGGQLVTSCQANQSRPDVNASLGITGNHGFNCVLPASYIGTGSHNLYVHAIDTTGTPNNVITGSPRALECATPPAPDATITVDAIPCFIQQGDSTCATTVTWEITNAADPNVYNTYTNTTVSSGDPSGSEPVALERGIHTFAARDNTNTLESTNVSAECVSGTNWNPVANICDIVPPPPPEPEISLDLSRELIRSGETVDVTVDVEAEYPAECTVYGVESTPIVFMHNGTPADPISGDVFTSRPLKAAQVVTVTCVPTPANGASSNTSSARVDVIPVVQEI